MINLTPDAKRRFDDYLERTRSVLRGTRAIEPEEVEQNVIEHVELALAGVPSPVGVDPLRTVLEQLGPPERWLPEDEQPQWRRVMGRLINGPEDWRLAYISFAFTLLMFLVFPIAGPILLPIAYLVSRAHVQLMQEKGEPLGARGWLVLPPIVMLFMLFIGTLLFVGVGLPAAFGSEQGLGELGLPDPGSRAERVQMFAGFLLLSAGSWWIVLSAILAWAFRPIRWLFAPLLANVRRGHVLWLTGVGAALAAVGGALLWAVV